MPGSTVQGRLPLALFLLGTFRLERDGQPIHLPRRKLEALLAYFALFPGPHPREKLAALFWGDSSDPDARASLRNALAVARKFLGTEIFETTDDAVQLNPAVPVWVDASAFRRGVANQRQLAPYEFLPVLELYRGDLLAEFYDEWVAPLREQFRRLYLDALSECAGLLRVASDYAGALEAAQMILRTDPANERAHQHAMFCLHALGNRNAALEQYDNCVRTLREELGVEPSPETVTLYRQLKQTAEPNLSPAARLTNLPIPLTAFIGRAHERQELEQRLTGNKSQDQDPVTRLLTLTGAGGSGKTRLAIQVAGDLAPAFRDGVWWVDLAGVRDPTLVPQVLARAMGVVEVPNQPLSETLANFLFARQLLLVLDNCEHLVLACAQLAEQLLQNCARLTIIATSREVLGIPGESAFLVPTLALPPHDESLAPEALGDYEAIRLFVNRAKAARSDFKLDRETAPIVAQICERLDGIPLAIELAAARAKVLTVEHIRERLDDRFNFLTTGSRTALPRHQTLRATMDWSYDLLPDDARVLLRRLSPFVGGFTLQAAERVCADAQLPSRLVLEVLGRLVDRSLVLVEQGAQGANERYRMLETIREYARDKLIEAGEGERLRTSHLDYFVSLVERAEGEWYGPKRLDWFKQLEREHDNLGAAIESSLTLPGGIERGLRLAGVLGHFWAWRTHKSEGRYWLDKLLAASRDTGSGTVNAQAGALLAVGLLALQQTDYLAASERLEASAALYKELGDQRGLALALLFVGLQAGWRGEWQLGHRLKAESVGLFRKEQDKWGLAYALSYLGENLITENDYAGAQLCLDESLSLFQEVGDEWTMGVPLDHMGSLKYREGDYQAAGLYYERAQEISQALDDQWGIAYNLGQLGDVANAQGDYKRARVFYTQSRDLFRTLGVKLRIAGVLVNLGQVELALHDSGRAISLLSESLELYFDVYQSEKSAYQSILICLVGLAAAAIAKQQPHRAARLLGAAAGPPQDTIGTRLLSEFWIAEYERLLASLPAQLDKAEFELALAQGRAMTHAEAVEYALSSKETAALA